MIYIYIYIYITSFHLNVVPRSRLPLAPAAPTALEQLAAEPAEPAERRASQQELCTTCVARGMIWVNNIDWLIIYGVFLHMVSINMYQ